MPGYNGMGPNSQGPMTGRGMGYCGERTSRRPMDMNYGMMQGQFYGRGRGGMPRGCGNGRGFGGGRGGMNNRSNPLMEGAFRRGNTGRMRNGRGMGRRGIVDDTSLERSIEAAETETKPEPKKK